VLKIGSIPPLKIIYFFCLYVQKKTDWKILLLTGTGTVPVEILGAMIFMQPLVLEPLGLDCMEGSGWPGSTL
jgi:hypothetical protein